MFKTVEELQNFITWCSSKGIRRAKVDGVEVEFWTLELPAVTGLTSSEEKDTSETFSDSTDVTDEDLYFSAQ